MEYLQLLKRLIIKTGCLLLVLALFEGAASSWASDSDTLQPAAASDTEAASLPEQRLVAPVNVPMTADPDYQIGPGDLIEIAVWKDEALTKTVNVLPDGKINFPLIGEVTAGGKTVASLKEELTQRLTRYVPDLVLSVEVKQANSMLVYVIGRVNNPGRLVLNTQISVLQALAMAGGFNPYASKNRVKIFRQDNGQTNMLPFHYTDVIEGKRLMENIVLRRGDVIVVP